jgi:hypothetical protein
MHTNALINPPAAPARSAPGIDAGAEILPLVDAVAGYGPPVIFVAGPWVLLALVLSGPAALLLTLVAVVLAAATVVAALIGAVVAIAVAPCLLVGRLRARRAIRAHAAPLVPAGAPRVIS